MELNKRPSLAKVEEVDTEEDPNEQDLCEVIIMIKERFPRLKLGRLIKLLHDNLVRQENEEIEQRKRKKTKKKSLILQNDEYLSQEELTDLEKKKMQQDYQRKFENSEASPRFYEQREIAKLFCSKGYGYPTAREYLGENITPNRYNNVVTTIVRLSYRKLEYFIIKHLNPTLAMISREELKMIKTPLVNCRNWMTDIQSDNFHRFVKITYKIATEDPQVEVVQELYEAIMEQLRKRNVNYKHYRRGEEFSGWTEEMENLLGASYIRQKDIIEVQREMLGQFPGYRTCLEVAKLKAKIERLLRAALRKIGADKEKFGLQDVPSINEFMTNKIIRSPMAHDLRKKTMAYLLDRDCNAKKLRWVLETLEEYLVEARGEVEEIEDSSCQYLPKQEHRVEVKLSEELTPTKEEFLPLPSTQKKEED